MSVARITIIVFALFSTILLAGCGFRASDFNGSWEGDSVGINGLGDIASRQRLVLEADDQGCLRGSIGWWNARGHNAEGEVVDRNTEELIGLANFKNGTFVVVETAESGTLVGKLFSDGSLELLRTQPGDEPVVTGSFLKPVDGDH